MQYVALKMKFDIYFMFAIFIIDFLKIKFSLKFCKYKNSEIYRRKKFFEFHNVKAFCKPLSVRCKVITITQNNNIRRRCHLLVHKVQFLS